MHWVIPFAGALSPAAAEAASTLDLPHLERLLARLAPGARDEGDEHSLSPPHERALAAAWGWPPAGDGLLPMAAMAARADGLAVPDDGRGWALLSPTHWHLGTEQVSLTHPDDLALGEAEARAFFDALAPLFAEDGLPLQWGAPTRWYIAHERLARLPSASIDRVVGRNVDLWLNTHPEARPLRRLQAEAQMLLHTHPLNQTREERGLRPVNSFWLSGTGATAPAAAAAAVAPVQYIDALRASALADDWAAWREAWARLDGGALAQALASAEAGQPVMLTLCGERHAQNWTPARRGRLARWFAPRRVAAAPWLTAL